MDLNDVVIPDVIPPLPRKSVYELTTEWERIIIQYQVSPSTMGHFFHSLVDALFYADTDNQKRIAKGFPELFEAYQNWRTNLRQRLEAHGHFIL